MKDNMNSVVLCLFEVLVGVLLLLNPQAFANTIVLIGGAALIIYALFNSVKYFRTEAKRAANEQGLMKALLALTIGLYCVAKSEKLIETYSIINIICGLTILIAGLGKVQIAVDMLRVKSKKWFLFLISAFVSLACAALILSNPFESDKVLWIFTGIVLIVEAVADFIALLKNKPQVEEEEEEQD